MKIKTVSINDILSFNRILRVSFSFLSILIVCLVGCDKRTFDTDQELLTYIRQDSNEYIQSKSINGIDFELLYRPTDLLVNQELNNSNDINKLRNKYKDFIYFNLSISANEEEILSAFPKNRAEYSLLVNQLTFKMNKNIVMLNNHKDTIPLIDIVSPRLYGMDRKNTLLLIFNRDHSKLKDKTLNLYLKDFGLNVGEIRFRIPTETIKNEPTIAFKSS